MPTQLDMRGDAGPQDKEYMFCLSAKAMVYGGDNSCLVCEGRRAVTPEPKQATRQAWRLLQRSVQRRGTEKDPEGDQVKISCSI